MNHNWNDFYPFTLENTLMAGRWDQENQFGDNNWLFNSPSFSQPCKMPLFSRTALIMGGTYFSTLLTLGQLSAVFLRTEGGRNNKCVRSRAEALPSCNNALKLPQKKPVYLIGGQEANIGETEMPQPRVSTNSRCVSGATLDLPAQSSAECSPMREPRWNQ